MFIRYLSEGNMSEHKIKKYIIISLIIAVLSIIAVLTVVIITVNIENWNSEISAILKMINRASWACYLVSMFAIAFFRQKIKTQKTDDKIKKLEQEIEWLKMK